MREVALYNLDAIIAVGYRVQPNHHALDRMEERGAVLADFQNALLTATGASWQAEHGSWKVVGGVDLDGDGLNVALEFTSDLLVRTVF